jgi:hypothetical protein
MALAWSIMPTCGANDVVAEKKTVEVAQRVRLKFFMALICLTCLRLQ